MYKFVKGFSSIIRLFYLPNPFEALSEYPVITLSNFSFEVPPLLLNIFAETFIHLVTYMIVGEYYTKGANPVMGSFLYLLLYCIHIFMLWLMSLANFDIWAIGLVICAYMMGHLMFNKIKSRRYVM